MRDGHPRLAACVAVALLVAPLVATPAGAQPAAGRASDCDEALERASEETRAQDASASLAPLRDLVVAARRLDDAGYEELCVSVIEAVREMARAEDAPPRPPVIPPQDRSRAAREAAPFRYMARRMSSDLVIDWQVRTMRGAPVGWVDGVVTANGEGVTHLIVGHGGLLGIGDREVAVPARRLRFDVTRETFYVDATPQWFDRQPDWNPTAWFGGPRDWARPEPQEADPQKAEPQEAEPPNSGRPAPAPPETGN